MKIILHGGYKGFHDGAGSDTPLFQKLIDAARSADQRVLIAFLGQETLSDFPHMDELKNSFQTLAPEIELVIAEQSNFAELLPQHQVLFMQGGKSMVQKEFLNVFSKDQLIENKVMLAGSSAGASMLCHTGFSKGGGAVPLEGKNIVPIGFMPHAATWPVADYLPILQKACDKPIITVEEEKFVEVYVYV